MIIVDSMMVVVVSIAKVSDCTEGTSNSATGKIAMAALDCTTAVKYLDNILKNCCF